MSLNEAHVFIEAPPTVITSEFYGLPHHLVDERSSNPGTLQAVFSDTVPAGKIRYLGSAILDCRTEAEFVVKIDGTLVGSGRTGPGAPMAKFKWSPLKEAGPGSVITMEVTTRNNSPVVTMRSYLNGSQDDQ